MPDKQFTEISFYIVPHADDWQLFMNPNAYNDLVAHDSKVIFIITTAGDAGIDENYWCAREEGAKSSIRFCLASFATLAQSNGFREFNGHIINYWTVNNATCYFLRLPDGNLDGKGFSSRNYQSLSKFKAGQISSLTAIDNSATYHSWTDFYTTLENIIISESAGIQNKWINYLNPDSRMNPNDHPDHIATGHAIQQTSILSNLKQALFVGYSSRNGLKILPYRDLFWKVGMFSAYQQAVLDISGYSTLHEDIQIYQEWCLRSAQFINHDSVNMLSKQINTSFS